MKHCRECGTPLRGHEDAVRTRLQAFAEACPEVVEVLELFDKFAWTAVTADCDEAAAELNRRINACRDLLRRMTAPAGETQER